MAGVRPTWSLHSKWEGGGGLVSDSCNLMGYSPPGSSVHGIIQSKNTGVGYHFLLQGIFQTQGSDPGIKPRSPTLQADSSLLSQQGSSFQKCVGVVYENSQCSWACDINVALG